MMRNLLPIQIIVLITFILLVRSGFVVYGDWPARLGYFVNIIMLITGLEAGIFAFLAYQIALPSYKKLLDDLNNLARENDKKKIPIEAEIIGLHHIEDGMPFLTIWIKGSPNEEIKLQEAQITVERLSFLDSDSATQVSDHISFESKTHKLTNPIVIYPNGQGEENMVPLAILQSPRNSKSHSELYPDSLLINEDVLINIYAKVSNNFREDIISLRRTLDFNGDGELYLADRQGTMWQGLKGLSENIANYMPETIEPPEGSPILAISARKESILGEPILHIRLVNPSCLPLTINSCRVKVTPEGDSCRTYTLKSPQLVSFEPLLVGFSDVTDKPSEFTVDVTFTNGITQSSLSRGGWYDPSKERDFVIWEANSETANRELRERVGMFDYMNFENLAAQQGGETDD